MIEIINLTRKYGNKNAVNDITFTVNEGEILGFLGPNGAGKSTTMNVITGYLSATSGTVKIGGFDILDNPIEAKKQIGYLPEQPPLYNDLTVKEYLDFVFDLKKCKLNKKEHIEEIIDVVRIKEVYHRLINNLSKGYKQRVGLAQALIGAPSVLILDEPTVGLDPKEIIEIRNLIKKLGKSRTVILSSHILSEIQAVCERVVVINNGKLVADGTPDDLTRNTAESSRISVRIAGTQKEIIKIIKNLSGVKYCEATTQVEKDSYDYIVESEHNIDIRRPLFFELAKAGHPILSLKPLDISLEDAFIRIIDSNKETKKITATDEQNESKDENSKGGENKWEQ